MSKIRYGKAVVNNELYKTYYKLHNRRIEVLNMYCDLETKSAIYYITFKTLHKKESFVGNIENSTKTTNTTSVKTIISTSGKYIITITSIVLGNEALECLKHMLKLQAVEIYEYNQ